MLHVSQLYIYPIKSLGGISLKNAIVTDRGFKYDRRWMLVDEQNQFLSQRELAPMALLKVSIAPDGLMVTHAVHHSSVIVPFEPLLDELLEVSIWDDTCIARRVSNEADHWFSNVLGIKCKLVYMPDDTHRLVDQKYAGPHNLTSFSDAYPFMMIGELSLRDLNSRLDASLLIDRFRPNIVFSGGEPFLEDKMQHIRINHIDLYGVKLCARCPVITIDQATAIKGKEPLKTLSGYRFKNNKVMFGQNLIHKGQGEINVGDQIEVLQMHTDERFLV